MVITCNCYAQDTTMVDRFCIATIKEKSNTKVVVSLDYGQGTSVWQTTQHLKDDAGKEVNFNSTV